MRDVRSLRLLRDKFAAERQSALSALDRAKAAAVAAQTDLADAEEAQSLVQAAAQAAQRQAHDRLAGVVSRCLQSVFGDNAYRLLIDFDRKRGRTEALLRFQRDDKQFNPLDSSGGGVVDVASFALRVACLMMSKPALRRLVVADEPFRFVSAEYRPAVRELVEKLAEEAGIQFVIVTHDPEFQIGEVVQL